MVRHFHHVIGSFQGRVATSDDSYLHTGKQGTIADSTVSNPSALQFFLARDIQLARALASGNYGCLGLIGFPTVGPGLEASAYSGQATNSLPNFHIQGKLLHLLLKLMNQLRALDELIAHVVFYSQCPVDLPAHVFAEQQSV